MKSSRSDYIEVKDKESNSKPKTSSVVTRLWDKFTAKTKSIFTNEPEVHEPFAKIKPTSYS